MGLLWGLGLGGFREGFYLVRFRGLTVRIDLKKAGYRHLRNLRRLNALLHRGLQH